jgi:hypothetical protein
MLNLYWEPLEFTLPPATQPMHPWLTIFDTYQTIPEQDSKKNINIVHGPTYQVRPRSIVLLGNGLLELGK